MSQNLYIITIVLCLFNLNVFPQERLVRQALKKGKNNELIYIAIANQNSFITADELVNWYKKNGDQYYLIDFVTEAVWFAGKKRVLISNFSFIESKDLLSYNYLQAEKIRQKALEAELKAKLTPFDVAIIGATAFIFSSAVQGISNHIDNIKNGVYKNYTDEDYSSNTSSNLSSNLSPKNSSITKNNINYKTIQIPKITSRKPWKKGDYGSDEFCEICFGEVSSDEFECGTLYFETDTKRYKIRSYSTWIHYNTEEQALRALYVKEKYDETIKF